MRTPFSVLHRVPRAVAAVLSAAAAVSFGGSVRAQGTSAVPAPTSGQTSAQAPATEMSITPYLWFSGLHGTVGAKGLTTDVSSSFSDLFDHLNIGAMLFLEGRRGREVSTIDAMYMKLTEENDTPGGGFSSVKATSQMLILAPQIGWRVKADARSVVDVLGGIRLWYLKNTVDFRGGTRPGKSATDAETWVDPLVGLRVGTTFQQKWHATLKGDIGGFGVGSEFAWQLLGALGYELNPRTSLQLAYRYLDTDYRKNGFVFDTHMDGPLLGVTFKL